MVKVKRKTDFKKSLRDAQAVEPKNPYVPPEKPDPAALKRAEDACKELASHEVANRDIALEAVHTLLRRLELHKENMDVILEFEKMWRGLFYCMWHSDKPLVQLDCAERIAGLVMTLKGWDLRAVWMKCGWTTLHKEWGGIDKWRVNKFYSLMRFMFNRELEAIAEGLNEFGDSEESEIMLSAFCEPLIEIYGKGMTGIGSHITDVLIEECVKTSFSSFHFTLLFLQLLLPVLCSGDRDQCSHIYDFVWQKLLGGYKEDEETLEWLAEVDFETIGEALREAAIDEQTIDKNRPLLVQMSEDLDAFQAQAEDFDEEEMVEVDSEEELAEVRLETRKQLEQQHREGADTEGRRRRERKETRALERRLKKAAAKGDDKAMGEVKKAARVKGLKLPQLKKKKKGKGNLKLAADGKPMKKIRHRKRRI